MNLLNGQVADYIDFTGSKLAGSKLDTQIASLGAADQDNAKAVYLRHGQNFAYNEAFGVLFYNGKRWTTECANQELDHAIVETLAYRYYVATTNKQTDIADKCVANNHVINAVKARFLALRELYVKPAEFDANPDLLNVNNGVIDLRTGELLPHSPQYKLTHLVAVDYDKNADSSAWLNWLGQVIMDFDSPEVQEYVQTAVGYSITGHTREECLFYTYGKDGQGRNGKGVFCTVIQSILGLGQLADSRSVNTFSRKRDGSDQGFDLAGLANKRLVVASESEKQRELNEAMVKTVTGRDPITASYKGKDQFTFVPKFKVWIASNFKPKGDVDDGAFWARLRVIIFPHSFEGRENTQLKDQFTQPEFLKGVLAWAVQGSVNWYKQPRIQVPQVFKDALKQVRSEYDTVQQWLDSGLVSAVEGAFELTKDLYDSYKEYCESESYSDFEHLKRNGFTKSLTQKGFDTKAVEDCDRIQLPDGTTKRNQKRGVRGLRLLLK